jgi:hypothetical protein
MKFQAQVRQAHVRRAHTERLHAGITRGSAGDDAFYSLDLTHPAITVSSGNPLGVDDGALFKVGH